LPPIHRQRRCPWIIAGHRHVAKKQNGLLPIFFRRRSGRSSQRAPTLWLCSMVRGRNQTSALSYLRWRVFCCRWLARFELLVLWFGSRCMRGRVGVCVVAGPYRFFGFGRLARVRWWGGFPLVFLCSGGSGHMYVAGIVYWVAGLERQFPYRKVTYHRASGDALELTSHRSSPSFFFQRRPGAGNSVQPGYL